MKLVSRVELFDEVLISPTISIHLPSIWIELATTVSFTIPPKSEHLCIFKTEASPIRFSTKICVYETQNS